MNIVIEISGEMTLIDVNIFSKWKIREKTLIGDIYFMRTQSGDYFSISKNYYQKYLTHLRDLRIDRVIED